MSTPLPENLLAIRHGQSEGNKANRASRELDDHSMFTEDFRNKPSSEWDLIEEGRAQAVAAGEWLKNRGPQHYSLRVVSPYTRTRQTAELLAS